MIPITIYIQKIITIILSSNLTSKSIIITFFSIAITALSGISSSTQFVLLYRYPNHVLFTSQPIWFTLWFQYHSCLFPWNTIIRIPGILFQLIQINHACLYDFDIFQTNPIVIIPNSLKTVFILHFYNHKSLTQSQQWPQHSCLTSFHKLTAQNGCSPSMGSILRSRILVHQFPSGHGLQQQWHGSLLSYSSFSLLLLLQRSNQATRKLSKRLPSGITLHCSFIVRLLVFLPGGCYMKVVNGSTLIKCIVMLSQIGTALFLLVLHFPSTGNGLILVCQNTNLFPN